ncbi:MAG: oligosaccharide flippase family protein [Candidatus Bathyarchaeia archaeon]
MELHGDLIDFAGSSARDSFVLFVGDFSSAAILAVSSIFIARFLGPENYSVYSLSFVAPALVISFVGLGLDSAAIRFTAKYIAEGRKHYAIQFLKSILAFRFATGVLASFISFILSDAFAGSLLDRPNLASYIRLLSMLVLFETLFSLLYGLFIGLNTTRYASIMKVLMATFKGAAAPTLVLFGLDVYGALIGHMLSYIIPSIMGLLILYLHHLKFLKMGDLAGQEGAKNVNNAKVGYLKETIKFCLPIYTSSLLSLLLGNYQAILLARCSSDIEIGCFKAATNISTILTVVSTPIITALFPAFSRLNSHRLREEVGDLLHLSVKYSSLIIIPMAVLLACISNYLVDVVYGASYILAGEYLALYSMIHVLIGLGSGIFISLFNGLGETSLTLRVNIVNLAIFMAIAPPLVISYNVKGIIISLLISSLISTLYARDLAVKKLDINLRFTASAKIYAASAVSAIPALILIQFINLPSMISLLLVLATYTITYLTLSPVLKAVNEVDLKNLERILGRIRLLKPVVDVLMGYETRIMGIFASR